MSYTRVNFYEYAYSLLQSLLLSLTHNYPPSGLVFFVHDLYIVYDSDIPIVNNTISTCYIIYRSDQFHVCAVGRKLARKTRDINISPLYNKQNKAHYNLCT